VDLVPVPSKVGILSNTKLDSTCDELHELRALLISYAFLSEWASPKLHAGVRFNVVQWSQRSLGTPNDDLVLVCQNAEPRSGGDNAVLFVYRRRSPRPLHRRRPARLPHPCAGSPMTCACISSLTNLPLSGASLGGCEEWCRSGKQEGTNAVGVGVVLKAL